MIFKKKIIALRTRIMNGDTSLHDFYIMTLAAGLHAGLTVVLNVEKEEYYCSGAESIGWKVSHPLFCLGRL